MRGDTSDDWTTWPWSVTSTTTSSTRTGGPSNGWNPASTQPLVAGGPRHRVASSSLSSDNPPPDLRGQVRGEHRVLHGRSWDGAVRSRAVGRWGRRGRAVIWLALGLPGPG